MDITVSLLAHYLLKIQSKKTRRLFKQCREQVQFVHCLHRHFVHTDPARLAATSMQLTRKPAVTTKNRTL
jgi:hypothetical protein